MIGSWMWNGVAGSFGCVIAFVGSFINNPLITSLERAVYGFVVAFVLMFGVRWFIGSFLGVHSGGEQDEYAAPSSHEYSSSASAYEAETPDELESLRRLIRDNIVGDFTTAENPSPSQMREPASTPPPAASRVADEVGDVGGFSDFSSFGSMDDLFQSFDASPAKSTTQEPSSQASSQSKASFNSSSSSPKGDLTAEDLANAIRTSFLDD